MASTNSYYNVPSQYVGSTLAQIGQINLPGIGPAKVNTGAFAGYDPNQPLTAGQQLAFTGDPNSGEAMSANQLFGPAISPSQYAAGQANQFQIQANQPAIAATGSAITNTQQAYGSAVSQYQGEIPNIQAQYQDILNQITKGVGASYADRGLSNASPQMSIDNAAAQLPAANQQSNAMNQFLNAIAGLQTSGAGEVSALQQTLGGLQSGNPLASLQYGQSQAMLPYQQAQSDAQTALANAQAAAAKYVSVPYLGAINAVTGAPINFNQTPSAQTSNGQTAYWVNGGWSTTPQG